MKKLIFYNQEHQNFYEEKIAGKRTNAQTKSLLYLLGLTEETRKNYHKIYNETLKKIIISGLDTKYHTGISLATTKLAFNLYNGYTGLQDIEFYSVVYIFVYKEFAPYFYEAIKLRFNI